MFAGSREVLSLPVFHSRCASEQAAPSVPLLSSSFHTSDPSLSPASHLLISISGFPSLRYFPKNSVHYSLLSNPTSSLCSARRTPWLLFQPPSPTVVHGSCHPDLPPPRVRSTSVLFPTLFLQLATEPSLCHIS